MSLTPHTNNRVRPATRHVKLMRLLSATNTRFSKRINNVENDAQTRTNKVKYHVLLQYIFDSKIF